MSNVCRLRQPSGFFLVGVNLRPRFRRFNESEYALIIDVLELVAAVSGLLRGFFLHGDGWDFCAADMF
jgi:hypothetical protein